MGDWETDHPGQTISQCVTSQETKLAEHETRISTLENNSVPLPDSVRYTFVEFCTARAANDERGECYANVILPFPFKTFPEHPEPATVSDAAIGYADLIYMDGTVYRIEHSDVKLSAEFVGAGVRLTATVPKSSLPGDIDTKSYSLHFAVHATIY